MIEQLQWDDGGRPYAKQYGRKAWKRVSPKLSVQPSFPFLLYVLEQQIRNFHHFFFVFFSRKPHSKVSPCSRCFCARPALTYSLTEERVSKKLFETWKWCLERKIGAQENCRRRGEIKKVSLLLNRTLEDSVQKKDAFKITMMNQINIERKRCVSLLPVCRFRIRVLARLLQTALSDA